MKKSDLKTGMRVKLRNGNKYIVLIDTVVNSGLVGARSCANLDYYNDDLTSKIDPEFDVIKVSKVELFYQMLNLAVDGDTIWSLQAPKEMTIAEIEAALGYPVKIIKEDKP